ncbi:MAG TPA: hypothetical protein VGK10_04670 [Prolixibacteraceae bacterium]|jgi:hypothetical protein
MNQQTEERIKIIRQFKSIGSTNALPSKRLQSIRLMAYLNVGLANLLLIYLMVITACALFQVAPFIQYWQKIGLTVFISLSFTLWAHFTYIEYLFVKHIKKLKEQDFSFDNTVNDELKGLIHDLNYNRFKPYWIIVPAIVLILASAMRVLEFNPFWNSFLLPVLIISILLSWRLNNSIFMVRQNIEITESNGMDIHLKETIHGS